MHAPIRSATHLAQLNTNIETCLNASRAKRGVGGRGGGQVEVGAEWGPSGATRAPMVGHAVVIVVIIMSGNEDDGVLVRSGSDAALVVLPHVHPLLLRGRAKVDKLCRGHFAFSSIFGV